MTLYIGTRQQVFILPHRLYQLFPIILFPPSLPPSQKYSPITLTLFLILIFFCQYFNFILGDWGNGPVNKASGFRCLEPM